jgi:hypothetical protein
MEEFMSFGESGGHWYRAPKGEPFYTINDRNVTLRDARKIGAVPSVTTVLAVVDKPALVNWKCEQAVIAALTMPRGNDSESEYVKRILKDSMQQALDAANKGTEIHDACEQLVKTGSCPDQYRAHADAAVAELYRLFPGVADWVAEQSFAHPLGFGGKVDLHSPSTGIVVDYKTKSSDFTDGKKIAFDQHWQLAAYQVGLGLAAEDNVAVAIELDRSVIDGMSPTIEAVTSGRWKPSSNCRKFNQCANIFVSRTHPGKVASHVWSADDIAAGWRVFAAALELWRELKNYDPRF